jgi:arsenate reductase
MSVIVYGIPNCDTVKKARGWLDARGIAYAFQDYKKQGADPGKLKQWVAAKGWEAVLNRRGTTFRALSDGDKAHIDRAKAIHLMQTHPSLIRRPVVEHAGGVLVGFDPAEWAKALA